MQHVNFFLKILWGSAEFSIYAVPSKIWKYGIVVWVTKAKEFGKVVRFVREWDDVLIPLNTIRWIIR